MSETALIAVVLHKDVGQGRLTLTIKTIAVVGAIAIVMIMTVAAAWGAGRAAVGSVDAPSVRLATKIAAWGGNCAWLAMITAAKRIAIAMIAMVAAVEAVGRAWGAGKMAVGLVIPPSDRPTTKITAGGGQRARVAMITATGRITIATIATVAAVAAVGGAWGAGKMAHHCWEDCDPNNLDCRSGRGGR